jgi:hypothetical protein
MGRYLEWAFKCKRELFAWQEILGANVRGATKSSCPGNRRDVCLSGRAEGSFKKKKVLEIEPRALCWLGKHCTNELHPQPRVEFWTQMKAGRWRRMFPPFSLLFELLLREVRDDGF